MSNTHFDALIIGGGPGGSAAATYLRQAGKSALVLEKEHFPRFHIGESLLPYNRRIFEEMGVLPALEAAGFPKKFGAQFHIGNGSKSLKFVFGRGCFTAVPEAFQVERAHFDHILLQHARQCGAYVREGWLVNKFEIHDDSVSIEASDPDRKSHTFRGSFLIDASGRNNLTGNQQGLRVIHPHMKKIALFGHFTGVRIDPGPSGGDTVIVRLKDKWFWLIPVTAEKVSVGCVMDQKEFAALRKSPAEVFNQIWQTSAPLRERLQNATLAGPVQTTADFSYHNKRLTDRRLLRVGDAAGFMDPIFSAGVYLAMFSGKLAANAVVESIKANDDGTPRFLRYEKRVWRAMKFYWEMVDNYYTTPFLEIFFNPREKFQLASAVNAALAGELEGGWKIWWRMRLFFAIVRLQARRPFMPQISFD